MKLPRRLVSLFVTFGVVSAMLAFLPHASAQVETCDGRAATIVGTDGADTIRGTSGDDVIVALAGDDRINGAGGNDIICGGSGNDKIKGSAGNDRLFGEGGRDQLTGGAGDDWLSGGTGKDKVNGGKGTDRCTDTTGDDTEDQCEQWHTLPSIPTPCDVLNDMYGFCWYNFDRIPIAEHEFGSPYGTHDLDFTIQMNRIVRLGGKTYALIITKSIDDQPHYLGAFFGAAAYRLDDQAWVLHSHVDVLGENGAFGDMIPPDLHVVKEDKAVFISHAGSVWQGVEISWAKAFGFDGEKFTWLSPVPSFATDYDETASGFCDPCESTDAELSVTTKLRNGWPKIKIRYRGSKNTTKTFTVGPAGVYTRYPKKQTLPETADGLLAAFVEAAEKGNQPRLRKLIRPESHDEIERAGGHAFSAPSSVLLGPGGHAKAYVDGASCRCSYTIRMWSTERGWRISELEYQAF